VEQKIFITVQGGVAEVCEDTVPIGVVVEVLDFDNLEGDPVEEMSCWSRSCATTGTGTTRIGAAAGIIALVRVSANTSFLGFAAWHDRVLGSFGYAELHHGFGGNLNRFPGCGIAAHTSLAVRFDQSADPRQHKNPILLGFVQCSL